MTKEAQGVMGHLFLANAPKDSTFPWLLSQLDSRWGRQQPRAAGEETWSKLFLVYYMFLSQA